MGTQLSKNDKSLKNASKNNKKQLEHKNSSVEEDVDILTKTIEKSVNLRVLKKKYICFLNETIDYLDLLHLPYIIRVISLSKEDNEMKIMEIMFNKDLNTILISSANNRTRIIYNILSLLIDIEKLGYNLSNINTSDILYDDNNNLYITNLYKNNLPTRNREHISLKEKISEITHCKLNQLIEELKLELDEEADETNEVMVEPMRQLLKENDFYFKYYHIINIDIKTFIDQQISECSNNESSKEFNMHYKRTGYIAMEYILFKAVSLQSIEKLILNSNDITDMGISYLSEALKYIPHLSILWLGDNKITSYGIKSFSKNLYYIKELKELNINWNCISDEGMTYLCKYLCDITNMEVLYLSGNNITDKGIKSFCDSIHYINKLRVLDVSNNKITNIGCGLLFDKLSICQNLQLVAICNNNIFNSAKLSNKLKTFHPAKTLDIRI